MRKDLWIEVLEYLARSVLRSVAVVIPLPGVRCSLIKLRHSGIFWIPGNQSINCMVVYYLCGYFDARNVLFIQYSTYDSPLFLILLLFFSNGFSIMNRLFSKAQKYLFTAKRGANKRKASSSISWSRCRVVSSFSSSASPSSSLAYRLKYVWIILRFKIWKLWYYGRLSLSFFHSVFVQCLSHHVENGGPEFYSAKIGNTYFLMRWNTFVFCLLLNLWFFFTVENNQVTRNMHPLVCGIINVNTSFV